MFITGKENHSFWWYIGDQQYNYTILVEDDSDLIQEDKNNKQNKIQKKSCELSSLINSQVEHLEQL